MPCYEALFLPDTHPSLTTAGEEIIDSIESGTFAKAFRDCLAEVEASLNAQNREAFFPDLAKLDATASSLTVQG